MLAQITRRHLLIILCGAACVSMAPGNQSNNPSGSQPQGASYREESQQRRYEQEEIAQGNPIDRGNIEKGYFRMGDWDNKENWRYNRDEFYKGETQAQAYRENHPYGPGGVGYDGDENYYRNLRRYQELGGNAPQKGGYRNQQYSGYNNQGETSNFGEGSPNTDRKRRYIAGKPYNYGRDYQDEYYQDQSGYQDRSGRYYQSR